MKIMFVILMKEIKSYFRSPLAYVLAALFSILSGWIFFNLLVNFVENVQNLPVAMQSQYAFLESVVFGLFGNMNLLFMFMTPLITMRLFAEENRDEVINLYYAAPIKDWQLVMAKYLASYFVILFILSMTFVYPIILWLSNIHDFSLIFSAYFAIALNLGIYIAIGIMASSFSSHQLVSALICFVIIFLFWVTTWILQITDDYFVHEIISYFAMSTHFENVSKGLMSTSDLLYYISVMFVFLFFTKKKIEARNW
jgi:ABC-2 type transport system permease protein